MAFHERVPERVVCPCGSTDAECMGASRMERRAPHTYTYRCRSCGRIFPVKGICR